MLHERLVRTVISCQRIDRADAEDAVQDAYIYALRTQHPWDGRSKLYTWLTRVAINASKMRGRSRLRIEKHETVIDDAFGIADTFSPHDRLFAMEKFEVFKDVLMSEMPERNRKAILLLIADPDGGYKGVGDKIGVSANTLKSQIYRARKELQTIL